MVAPIFEDAYQAFEGVIVMRKKLLVLALSAALGVPSAAQAQFAVIDVGAIVQMVQEVATLAQQLKTAENQLLQAQSEFQAMTGGRGMEGLLSGVNRNYLPSDSTQLLAAVQQTGGALSAFSSGVQKLMQANAVLTPAQVAALSPTQQAQLMAARQSAATLTTVSSQALSTTSTRFVSMQQLIGAIPSASDQKGILDLQARIQAEQAMLQNDSTKMNTLYQLSQAQELTRQQRLREQAIADVGSLRDLPPLKLP
jgi:type IV secretion system protein VirB5